MLIDTVSMTIEIKRVALTGGCLKSSVKSRTNNDNYVLIAILLNTIVMMGLK